MLPLAPATLILLLATGFLLASGPQTAAAPVQDCKAPEHRQFDFWLGSWDVTAQGKINERATDGGKVWTTAFDGRYVKQRVS